MDYLGLWRKDTIRSAQLGRQQTGKVVVVFPFYYDSILELCVVSPFISKEQLGTLDSAYIWLKVT
jgi:hypothetical protein